MTGRLPQFGAKLLMHVVAPLYADEGRSVPFTVPRGIAGMLVRATPALHSIRPAKGGDPPALTAAAGSAGRRCWACTSWCGLVEGEGQRTAPAVRANPIGHRGSFVGSSGNEVQVGP